jgi:hypothetical protein
VGDVRRRLRRTVRARREKRTFVWRKLLDLASIALRVLRPLRLLRLVALITVLNRKATSSLQGRVAIYVGSSVVLIVFVAALAVLDTECGKPSLGFAEPYSACPGPTTSVLGALRLAGRCRRCRRHDRWRLLEGTHVFIALLLAP